jgi:hypothetical protein
VSNFYLAEMFRYQELSCAPFKRLDPSGERLLNEIPLARAGGQIPMLVSAALLRRGR